MGVIKTVLGLVILAVIVVGGFWLYATYTIASANDGDWQTQAWTEVNSRLPEPLRGWACSEIQGRLQQMPAHCATATGSVNQ